MTERVADLTGENTQPVARKAPDPMPGRDRERPWSDKELLEKLYHDMKLSMNQISKGWGCSNSTISKWIGRHDIEKRTRSEASLLRDGTLNQASFYTHPRGYERWRSGEDTIDHHRLLAALKYGVDAIRGMDVHHKNGVPWDNRLENIEILEPSEHYSIPWKVKGLNRIRIAEFYEHGDISSRDLADMFDITGGTVLEIHREFYSGNEENSERDGQTSLEEYE